MVSPTRLTRRTALMLPAAAVLAARSRPASAEAQALRISRGYGTAYLPLYIMEKEGLIERRARDAGLGDIQVTWTLVDGGNQINDAMLSSAIDIATIGVPAFMTLWAKTRSMPQQEMSGLASVSSGAMWLNTRNPAIKSLKDYTEKDRIALPGIKTSFAAVILQMAAAAEFGPESYAKLDHLTVGLPHPEAVTALLSGQSEITSHVASPPFSYMELDAPGIQRVFNSADLLGHITTIMAFTTRRFYDANPRLAQVFVSALDDASKLIAADRPKAAKNYLELSKVKATEAQLLRILDDPDNLYFVAPQGMMRYADFMFRVGTIKQKPSDWKELFLPPVHAMAGN